MIENKKKREVWKSKKFFGPSCIYMLAVSPNRDEGAGNPHQKKWG